MTPRPRASGRPPPALLVHGMGSHAGWWQPLLPLLAQDGLDPRPLALPDLEVNGVQGWLEHVGANLGHEPCLLIGHSLGAAVCLQVARQHPVNRLVLLACPATADGSPPLPPPHTRHSSGVLAEAGALLRSVGRHPLPQGLRAVHFVGAQDHWVPVARAERLPLPLHVIPGAGHSLIRSTVFQTALRAWLAETQSGRRCFP